MRVRLGLEVWKWKKAVGGKRSINRGGLFSMFAAWKKNKRWVQHSGFDMVGDIEQ